MIEMLNDIADKWFAWELAMLWQVAVLFHQIEFNMKNLILKKFDYLLQKLCTRVEGLT